MAKVLFIALYFQIWKDYVQPSGASSGPHTETNQWDFFEWSRRQGLLAVNFSSFTERSRNDLFSSTLNVGPQPCGHLTVTRGSSRVGRNTYLVSQEPQAWWWLLSREK
jgi:hypothetical protein